jgi:hypothetical protein
MGLGISSSQFGVIFKTAGDRGGGRSRCPGFKAITPLFFNQTSVPFDYQPDAPEPRHWLTFLEALWPTEPETINVLSEWFGYVVSGRTDLHKILMMVGPTRGGKGDCPHSHGSRWPGERCGADIKQP